VIVTGVLSGDAPDFDSVIDRLAKAEAEVDAWMEKEYKAEGRRAEEHEVDAIAADHIVEEPGERYYNSREGMKAAVRLRSEREGVGWVPSHPHRQLVVCALADLIGDNLRNCSPEDLRQLLGCADSWARSRTWWAAARHWDPSLDDLLEIELCRTDLNDSGLRETLVEVAAITRGMGSDPVAMLARVAASTSTERRLELIRDVMATSLDSDRSEAGGTARRGRAERLANTFPSPEDELGRAVAAMLAGENLRKVGKALSGPACSLLSEVLPRARTSVAAPLVCLAAAIGIDLIATAERLLATDEVADGEAAVLSVVIDGRTAAVATLVVALRHARYPVRRDALRALVERADLNDRRGLVAAAHDRSADVRLAWADLMRTHRWPEAVDSLVELLSDRRDFGNDRAYGSGPSWSQFRVARAAAGALGAYDALTMRALDALIAAAANSASSDPFVACGALSALVGKEDDRILPALLAGLSSRGLSGAPRHRPLAQAASWALFDRAAAGKLKLGDASVARAACHDSSEVAGPLLMAFGIVGGPTLDALLSSLGVLGLTVRAELVMIAAAATNNLPRYRVGRAFTGRSQS
jgi:hypothetical protein